MYKMKCLEVSGAVGHVYVIRRLKVNNLNSVHYNPRNKHSIVMYQGNETDKYIVTLRCILCILAVTEYSELMLVLMMSVNELWAI
jgi:hypothetical protein